MKLGWLHTHTATQAVTVLVGSQDLETAVFWQTIQSTALDVLNMQHQRRQSIADSSSGGFSTHRDGGLLREEAHTFLSDVLGGRQAHCLAGHGWRGRPGRRGCCLRLSCRGAPGALERVALRGQTADYSAQLGHHAGGGTMSVILSTCTCPTGRRTRYPGRTMAMRALHHGWQRLHHNHPGQPAAQDAPHSGLCWTLRASAVQLRIQQTHKAVPW